jgi:hypothetical protein
MAAKRSTKRWVGALLACACCYLHLQLCLLVDAARPDGVARGFVDGHALAGNGGLVHAAAASGDCAIQWNTRTRGNTHRSTCGHIGGGHGLAAAIGLHHFSGVRGQRQQVADGQTGAIHGLVFNALGSGVKCHHHGRFWPLTNA